MNGPGDRSSALGPRPFGPGPGEPTHPLTADPGPALHVPGYEILGAIHEGSMSTVYKARQLSVDRLAAVKVLRGALAGDDEYADRFRREVRIAARLSHPHIVTTLDAGEAGGRPYLVTEYVEGETVQDALSAGRVFDEPEAVRIALAVARALAHAERHGLVHRDVKPANVILGRDGAVKLLDLGLARPTADEAWGIAEAGMAVGTPDYISPEQTRGQVDLDTRADLYSLGVTLYHMVTGRVPFPGATPLEVMRKHADPAARPDPPEAVNPAVSGDLGAVIRTLMARKRADRYQTPDDLTLDLERLLRGERPLIAQRRPESLAALAVGDPTAEAPGPVADPPPEPPPEAPGEEVDVTPLLLAPALLLALLLLAAVALLMTS